jgi:hypothetical protein
MSETGFVAQAFATALAALGWPNSDAISLYVLVLP